MSFNKFFDRDLKFGQEGEQWLTLLADERRLEVKRERDKWVTTGNLFFEFHCRGKASGLAVTTADFWCHILSHDRRPIGVLIVDTPTLKANLKRLIDEGRAKTIKGGDDNAAHGVLVPVAIIGELMKPTLI